jgi:20S proteasome alpha/beta subunit
MTVIVAITCQDGVVFASDSRTSYDNGLLRDDARKIHAVRFSDGNSGLIAQAGNDYFGGAIIERIQKQALSSEMEPRTLADLTQAAIFEERQKQQLGWNMSDDRFGEEWKSVEFQIMGATFSTETNADGIGFDISRVFSTGNHISQLFDLRDRKFHAIGLGADVAVYILQRFIYDGMRIQHAMLAAAFVVEEVKRVNAWCGGKTQLATIAKIEEDGVPAARICSDNVDQEIAEVMRFDAKRRAEWNSKMDKMLRDLTFKKFESANAQIGWSKTLKGPA